MWEIWWNFTTSVLRERLKTFHVYFVFDTVGWWFLLTFCLLPDILEPSEHSQPDWPVCSRINPKLTHTALQGAGIFLGGWSSVPPTVSGPQGDFQKLLATRIILKTREKKRLRQQESSSEIQRGSCRFPHLVCRSVVVQEALWVGLQSCFLHSSSSEALPLPTSYYPGADSFSNANTEWKRKTARGLRLDMPEIRYVGPHLDRFTNI